MDFWDNVSVNLFSNIIWVLVAYASMQVFKRVMAGRQGDIAGTSAGTNSEAIPPLQETPIELIRRVGRSLFDFAGLVISVLLICSFFVDSVEVWRHVLGWTLIAVVWAVWFWCTRDLRASRWLRRGGASGARIVWVAIAVVFWSSFFGGLMYLVYNRS